MFARARRITVAVVVIALAIAIAAGCGGGKGSSISPGLDWLPRNTAGFLLVDTDFAGASWNQVDAVGSRFDGWKAMRTELRKSLETSSGDGSYSRDIKPWLGRHAGIGILGIADSKNPDVIIWFDSTDQATATKSLKRLGTKRGSAKGHDLYQGGGDASDMWWTTGKDVVVAATSKAVLVRSIGVAEGGESIMEDDTAKDAAGKIGDDDVISFVMGHDGAEAALKDLSKQKGASAVLSSASVKDSLKAFKGFEFGLSASTDGFVVDGWGGFDRESASKVGAAPSGNVDLDLLEQMPATTAAAYLNSDLGGALKGMADGYAKRGKDEVTRVVQLEALVGITREDVAKALDGSYAIGIDSAGGKPGVIAAFENSGDATSELIDSLFGLAQMSGKVKVVDTTIGGTPTKQVTYQSTSAYVSDVDGTTLLSTSRSVIDGWGGGSTLGGSEAYRKAARAGDMPGKVSSLLFVNPKLAEQLASSEKDAIEQLAGKLPTKSASGAIGKGTFAETAAASLVTSLGGGLMWAETSKGAIEFHGFLHVPA